MKNALHGLLFLIILSSPSAIPTAQSADAGLSGESAYQEILKNFKTGALEPAIQKIEDFERSYAQNPQISNVRNLHGLALLALKRPQAAADQFKIALTLNDTPIFKSAVQFNLATAYFDLKRLEDTESALSKVDVKILDREVAVKFHALSSRLKAKQGNVMASSVELLKLSILLGKASDTRNLRIYQPELDLRLSEIKKSSMVEDLIDDFKESPYADRLVMRQASLLIQEGQFEEAKKTLLTLRQNYPQSEYYLQAGEMASDLGATSSNIKSDAKAIGVLLPLSGKSAKVGKQALQAIELAFGFFSQSGPTPKSEVVLHIQDSGDDPQTAVRGLYTLAIRHRVLGVIGPLQSKGIEQIARTAFELGVPLISLTQGQPEQDYPNYFTAGMTLKFQTDALSRHAVEGLQLKRFAIVYPRDRYGEQLMNLFWDAVESLGGRVTAVESYATGETDFRQVVDKLVGLHYTEARTRELQALETLRAQQNITRKTRKTEAFFNLKPIIDFDAVFIPDESKVLGQILPTFAYRDVDGVKFIGPSAWNSPELIARSQNFAENSIFGDLFFKESNQPGPRKLIQRYSQVFGVGQSPGVVDAMAYDAAGIVDRVIQEGADSRTALKSGLESVSDFLGVTGKISIKDRQFQRPLTLLTVKNSTIVETK